MYMLGGHLWLDRPFLAEDRALRACRGRLFPDLAAARVSLRPKSVILGVLSAAILYLVFVLGNALAPLIVHGAPSQVGGIYGLGAGTNRILVGLLLLFMTGPGEEIFWRGFLQSRMEARFGAVPGYLGVAAVYALCPRLFPQPRPGPRGVGGRGVLGRPLPVAAGRDPPHRLPFALVGLHLCRGARAIASGP